MLFPFSDFDPILRRDLNCALVSALLKVDPVHGSELPAAYDAKDKMIDALRGAAHRGERNREQLRAVAIKAARARRHH